MAVSAAVQPEKHDTFAVLGLAFTKSCWHKLWRSKGTAWTGRKSRLHRTIRVAFLIPDYKCTVVPASVCFETSLPDGHHRHVCASSDALEVLSNRSRLKASPNGKTLQKLAAHLDTSWRPACCRHVLLGTSWTRHMVWVQRHIETPRVQKAICPPICFAVREFTRSAY